MKNNIMILDCTLRDGGYINNWEFGKDNIKSIVEGLSCASIDIIEIGFLTDMPHTEKQSLFSHNDDLKYLTSLKGDSLLAGMIAIGEKELNPDSLGKAEDTGVDIVRITFHNNEMELGKAFSFARILEEKGYKVCMQPIGTTMYTEEELVNLINKANALKPYAFYLVDTLGTMYREDLLRLISITDTHLDKDIKIGFHSHNNLQLSYSNAQAIVELDIDRDFVIDSSLYGIGRGAGNLCTELIAQFCNEQVKSNYMMISILEIIDNYILPLSLEYKWGYNMHYNLAARYNCHPNYATYLMNKQTLKMNQVSLLLQSLPKETRHVFNKKLIEELYYNFQNNVINDKEVLEKLKEAINSQKVLLLAPGHTLVEYKKEIQDFIENEKPIVFGINLVPDFFNIDYIFVSNWKRFYAIDYDKTNAKIITTSNLPALSNKFMSVNYNDLCDYSFDEPDNAGMMLMRLMKQLGLKQVYLAGLDGFTGDGQKDYYDESFKKSVSNDLAKEKNDNIKKQIRLIENDIDLIFLTPSIYRRNDEKYKVILFDMDGTLADTSEGIVNCYKHAFIKLGKTQPKAKEFDGVIGGTIFSTFVNKFNFSEEEATQAVSFYRARYAEKGIFEAKLYDGMAETLAELKQRGYLLGVATLKAETFALIMLERMGIKKYFDIIHGADDAYTRTKEDIINLCIKGLNCNREECVLVGDSKTDAIGARVANVGFVGATYGFGFHGKEDVAVYNPVQTIDRPIELMDNFK